jgi:uncharacterized protein YjiS (DUF1127 family)
MATNISDQLSLGKVGAMFFARQSPVVEADRHPNLLQQFSDWRKRRAAESELSSLSDRELADIGLTRQQIPVLVRKGR